MECYSAMKVNEVMPLAKKWVNLEIIILSQTEKEKHHMIPFICGT